jgi:hypothetical protein
MLTTDKRIGKKVNGHLQFVVFSATGSLKFYTVIFYVKVETIRPNTMPVFTPVPI